MYSKIHAPSPASLIFDMKGGYSLHFLLVSTSLMEATDLRDRVYALLSLYSAWTVFMGNPPPNFKPDYNSNVIEVYGNVMRYLVKIPRNLSAREGRLELC